MRSWSVAWRPCPACRPVASVRPPLPPRFKALRRDCPTRRPRPRAWRRRPRGRRGRRRRRRRRRGPGRRRWTGWGRRWRSGGRRWRHFGRASMLSRTSCLRPSPRRSELPASGSGRSSMRSLRPAWRRAGLSWRGSAPSWRGRLGTRGAGTWTGLRRSAGRSWTGTRSSWRSWRQR